jgi:hypothetical protein
MRRPGSPPTIPFASARVRSWTPCSSDSPRCRSDHVGCCRSKGFLPNRGPSCRSCPP